VANRPIQVIAIRQHDERGVGQGRLLDDLAGVEGHGEALAAALGVPDDAGPPVAVGISGLDSGANRLIDGVVLVVAGQLPLDDGPIGLIDDEVPQQVQEPALFEDALDQHLQFRCSLGGEIVTVNRAPGH